MNWSSKDYRSTMTGEKLWFADPCLYKHILVGRKEIGTGVLAIDVTEAMPMDAIAI